MPTRTATLDDLVAVAEIYAHYVRTSVATFELEPPDAAGWRRRDGSVAGYAYCAPCKTRPAYAGTVEDSVYVSPPASAK